jgi:hypothetical protein
MDEDPVFVDDVTQTAYEAMLTRDWDGLRLLLHPYLHWTTSDGTRIRGRVTVMERLRHAAPPAAPDVVELRDGQIYRWQEPLREQ